tara:strand:- start:1881 stop:2723 length:843 start_codon:yes stop_codon:yes gene_type:complete
MALYDNFLNPENMYRRPSETMNTVSNYLGTNQATMPMGNNNLSTMMGMPAPQGGGAPFIQTENQNNNDDDYSSQNKNQDDLVAQFVGQVQGLSENQRNLLLQFVKSDGGVEPVEYAQLFGVSDDYAGRFQGLPNFMDLSSNIDNVFAYQSQQTGFEQENARQARLQQVLSSPVMGRGLGRGERNSLARRQLQDTYRQRIANVQEDTGRRYDQLLQDFNRSVGRGFSTAADIIAEDPSTTSTPYNQRYRLGEEITIGGERYVWNGTEFVAGEIFDSEEGDV